MESRAIKGFAIVFDEIKLLYLGSRPRSFAQKHETGLNTGLTLKTANRHHRRHFLPAQALLKTLQYAL